MISLLTIVQITLLPLVLTWCDALGYGGSKTLNPHSISAPQEMRDDEFCGSATTREVPATFPVTKPMIMISQEKAILIAREALKSKDDPQDILPPEVKLQDGNYIITFPLVLPPNTVGGDFDSKVTLDAYTGQVKRMEDSA